MHHVGGGGGDPGKALACLADGYAAVLAGFLVSLCVQAVLDDGQGGWRSAPAADDRGHGVCGRVVVPGLHLHDGKKQQQLGQGLEGGLGRTGDITGRPRRGTDEARLCGAVCV